MDGLDIFNVYVMGSIEMLTVFHFFTRFLKKKVKFIYYILFAIFGIAVIRIFTDGSIMELLVYVLLLMAKRISIAIPIKGNVLYKTILNRAIISAG